MTVYLLDHHRVAAQRLIHLTKVNSRVKKCIHFTGTANFMENCLGECPDLVLIRLGETPFNGLAAARKITALYRGVSIAFISSHPQYAALAWEAGASGFLLEPFEPEQLNRLLIQN